MDACWMESFQPSTRAHVSAVRRQFLAWLEPLNAPEEVVDELAVALTEACANAVEHGSPRGPQDSFLVRCRLEARVLVLEVIDHGAGFDFCGAACPDPRSSNERGRGLWLMACLTDRMQVRHEPGGTQVRLERNLAP